MIPSNFNYRSACILQLTDSFAVDGSLLGKHISFHYSDTQILSIVIPSVLRNNDSFKLVIPGILDSYGMDLSNWGEVMRYHISKDPRTVVAWISSILVEGYGIEPVKETWADWVQSVGKDFMHKLHVIKPEAIRGSFKKKGDLCSVSSFVYWGSDRLPHNCMNMVGVIDKDGDSLVYSDLRQGILNYSKVVSAPYEILDNARINLSHQDTRATILNCATVIEIMLKKIISAHLNSVSSSSALTDYVMRQADGYTKQVELCKKFSLPLRDMPKIHETVIALRNRVIHGGYVPTTQEAQTAYDNTRSALAEHNVQMFE